MFKKRLQSEPRTGKVQREKKNECWPPEVSCEGISRQLLAKDIKMGPVKLVSQVPKFKLKIAREVFFSVLIHNSGQL